MTSPGRTPPPHAEVVRRASPRAPMDKAGASRNTDREADDQFLYDALVASIRSAVGLPAAIWLLDLQTQSLQIRAYDGVLDEYAKVASARMSDGGVISQVIRTGQPQVIRSIENDERVRYLTLAQKARWISMLGFPVFLRGRAVGVIELLTFEERDLNDEIEQQMRPLAQLASAILASAERTREVNELARISKVLSRAIDFDQAMRAIVDSARKLTHADSSAIYLLREEHDRFVLGARSPALNESPDDFPRPRKGLTRKVIATGRPIRIDDATRDSRVRPKVVREGIRSFVGVRIQLEEESIGVLYVNGRRTKQFSHHDADLLQALANQASVSLGWIRLISRDAAVIQRATSELEREYDVATSVCREIHETFDYDFAAVQMIRPEEDTIETIRSTGIFADLEGRTKHHLAREVELRDIQADVAIEQRTEIIAGWDPRFDKWIFEENDHASLVRVFAPILIARDRHGKIVEDWYKRASWRVCVERSDSGNRRTALELTPESEEAEEGELTLTTLGTIEVGFCDKEHPISADDGRALLELVSRRALELYRTSLSAALECIVERACQTIRADSATLHLLPGHGSRRWIYEVCAGDRGWHILRNFPPRRARLGWTALKDDKPRIVPDLAKGDPADALSRYNPRLYREGVRAIAAYPLRAGSDHGILYLHFRQRPISEDEIRWAQLLVNRAVEAVRDARQYGQLRERARQLHALHAVVQSLVKPPEPRKVLKPIAWNAASVFGADVVTIYDYHEAQGEFETPPERAGRFLATEAMETRLGKNDAPCHLIRREEPLYETKSVTNEHLNASLRRGGRRRGSFVERERIQSSAAVPLRVDSEAVGMMFINYRRPHRFSSEEKNIIETLASAAAIAIKNRRLIVSLTQVDHDILTTLDLHELLDLIVERAVDVSGASRGKLWRLDGCTPVLEAQVPDTARTAVTTRSDRKEIELVARKQRYELVERGLAGRGRTEGGGRRARASLYVPLEDARGKTIGVLKVEGDRSALGNPRNQFAVRALATQAVVGIVNADAQERSLAGERYSAITELWNPVVHDCKDEFLRIQREVWQALKATPPRRSFREACEAVDGLCFTMVKEIGRLDSLMTSDQRGPVDLTKLLGRAMRTARSRVPNPEILARCAPLPRNLPMIRAGAPQLTHVFYVLLKNACEAVAGRGARGRVWVIAGEQELWGRRWVSLSVNDNGVGIRRSEIPKIMTIGYTTKAQSQGMGFGLWWARAYVRRLGGALTVSSREGKGTEVKLELRSEVDAA